MKIIQTSSLGHEFTGYSKQEGEWIYNGLDSMVTCEVARALAPQASPESKATFAFALALRAPLLEMMLRGVAVDPWERQRLLKGFRATRDQAEARLNQIAQAIWGKPLLANSPAQLKEFFYSRMALPEQHTIYRGERKVSCGREALEKLEEYYYARPIISLIFTIRDCDKKISVLGGGKKQRDALVGGDNLIRADGRFGTSFNIGGTESGRLSSSTSATGSGSNSQNITEGVRRIFITDPGYKLAYLDLSTAESLAVAFLSGDEAYIKACLSGDVHTFVCRLCWPDLPWTGDLRRDRAIAERPYYRHFSFRDMGKRGGHLSNYRGKPPTMARHLRLPEHITRGFQEAYFNAFPGIPRWHESCATKLEVDGAITTALGFKRYFLGRHTDESTLREAIAFEPQSLVAFILNTGMLKIWRGYRQVVQLLLQIHDAVLLQYPESEEDEIIPRLTSCLEIPVPITDIHGQTRVMQIGADAAVGWNWAKASDTNPGGLAKFRPGDTRQRPAMLRLSSA